MYIVPKKPFIQSSGIIVIRKKVTSEGWREYYVVEFAVPYKSKVERRKKLKQLMNKHSIVSVIPDDFETVESTPHNNFHTLSPSVDK